MDHQGEGAEWMEGKEIERDKKCINRDNFKMNTYKAGS